MKKKIVIGAIAAVFVFAVLLFIGRVYYPSNVAETAPAHAEEKMRSRVYKTDLKTFSAEAQQIIPRLSTWGRSWRHIATEAGESAVIVKAEVPVVVFTDDLRITAVKDDAGDAVTVNVRSASRVGKSDFGENRRHVLKILEALDARFAR